MFAFIFKGLEFEIGMICGMQVCLGGVHCTYENVIIGYFFHLSHLNINKIYHVITFDFVRSLFFYEFYKIPQLLLIAQFPAGYFKSLKLV